LLLLLLLLLFVNSDHHPELRRGLLVTVSLSSCQGLVALPLVSRPVVSSVALFCFVLFRFVNIIICRCCVATVVGSAYHKEMVQFLSLWTRWKIESRGRNCYQLCVMDWNNEIVGVR